jgi:hypothetical protein
MVVNASAGTPLVRPIRADRLQHGGEQLRSRLTAVDITGEPLDRISDGIMSTARLTRSYLEHTRALLRSGARERVLQALEDLRGTTEQLHVRLKELGPVLEAAMLASGKDQDALVETWFRSGGPRELSSESRFRSALSEHITALGNVRKSDLAHLACLWSDSQRYHAALRGLLNAPPTRPKEVSGFLEAVAGYMIAHVLPVDLEGLTGDPGLLEGIPAMIARLTVSTRCA